LDKKKIILKALRLAMIFFLHILHGGPLTLNFIFLMQLRILSYRIRLLKEQIKKEKKLRMKFKKKNIGYITMKNHKKTHWSIR